MLGRMICFIKKYRDIRDWIVNLFKTNSVPIAAVFFIIMIIVVFIHHDANTFSGLIASFGAVLVALKYKLDQANYHKSLFKERYKIFLIIDEILIGTLNIKDEERVAWRNKVLNKFGSIYRKSYFLFGKETHKFLHEFQLEVLNYLILLGDPSSGGRLAAYNVLSKLASEQELPAKFSEMKIDTY